MDFWITTSWDDGHVLDQRIGDLLDRYHLRGTFYIARDYLPDRLFDDAIADIANRHEIAAHTLTHPDLTQIAPSAARAEIIESRDWLQDVIGKPVTAFAYPKGIVNSPVRDLVAEAGFSVARTVEQMRLSLGDDPLLLPTTTYAFPCPISPTDSQRPRLELIQITLPHLWRLKLSPLALRSWSALALTLLERAAQQGGFFHLWGHSWEIERYDLWVDLERVLTAMSRTSGAHPVTNSELIALHPARSTQPQPPLH